MQTYNLNQFKKDAFILVGLTFVSASALYMMMFSDSSLTTTALLLAVASVATAAVIKMFARFNEEIAVGKYDFTEDADEMTAMVSPTNAYLPADSKSSLTQITVELDQQYQLLMTEFDKLKMLAHLAPSTDQTLYFSVEDTITQSQGALVQIVDYSQTLTLVMHQLHKDHSNLAQLQDFLRQLATSKLNDALGQSNQVMFEIVALIDTIKADLVASKVKLSEMLKGFDHLKSIWTDSLLTLKRCLEKSTDGQSHQAWQDGVEMTVQLSLQVQDRIKALMQQFGNAVWTEETTEPASYTQFDLMTIQVDETKLRAEDVLLEGIK